jgi:hypothetical protein
MKKLSKVKKCSVFFFSSCIECAFPLESRKKVSPNLGNENCPKPKITLKKQLILVSRKSILYQGWATILASRAVLENDRFPRTSTCTVRQKMIIKRIENLILRSFL